MNLHKTLNSLDAITTPMLMLICAVGIEASVLFNRALSESMDIWFRIPASMLFGFSVALPILLTSIHKQLLPGLPIRDKKIGFPELFGLFSAFMVLLLFDVFGEKQRSTSWYVLVSFLAIFIGLIDYLYAHLYVAKYNEEFGKEDLSKQYDEKCRELNEANQSLHECRVKLGEAVNELMEARQELAEFYESLKCVHCGELPATKSYSAKRNHENRCTQNPKNTQNEQ